MRVDRRTCLSFRWRLIGIDLTSPPWVEMSVRANAHPVPATLVLHVCRPSGGHSSTGPTTGRRRLEIPYLLLQPVRGGSEFVRIRRLRQTLFDPVLLVRDPFAGHASTVHLTTLIFTLHAFLHH